MCTGLAARVSRMRRCNPRYEALPASAEREPAGLTGSRLSGTSPAGRKVLFDSAAMKITNAAEANKYLYRPYRPGWEL